MLDKDARARLRTLSKDNAEDVGRHLVMAGRLMDDDPELAYRHAQTAAARAGRVDIVREAAAIAAYVTGRYAEALREFRTVTRLNGSHEHLALIADCERGLGRPERALEIAAGPEASTLTKANFVELQIVVAGARSDMGQYDAALLVLDKINAVAPEQEVRVGQAREEILRRAGRLSDEAQRDDVIEDDEWDDDVVVYDLEAEDPDGGV